MTREEAYRVGYLSRLAMEGITPGELRKQALDPLSVLQNAGAAALVAPVAIGGMGGYLAAQDGSWGDLQKERQAAELVDEYGRQADRARRVAQRKRLEALLAAGQDKTVGRRLF